MYIMIHMHREIITRAQLINIPSIHRLTSFCDKNM